MPKPGNQLRKTRRSRPDDSYVKFPTRWRQVLPIDQRIRSSRPLNCRKPQHKE